MMNTQSVALFLTSPDGGEPINVTPSLFTHSPDVRRAVFRAARESHLGAIAFLRDNFSLREVTQGEIDEYNKHLLLLQEDPNNEETSKG